MKWEINFLDIYNDARFTFVGNWHMWWTLVASQYTTVSMDPTTSWKWQCIGWQPISITFISWQPTSFTFIGCQPIHGNEEQVEEYLTLELYVWSTFLWAALKLRIGCWRSSYQLPSEMYGLLSNMYPLVAIGIGCPRRSITCSRPRSIGFPRN